MATFNSIQFGDNLDVTDLGGGVIRVDGSGGGGGGATEYELLSGSPVSIANNAGANLTWDTSAGPDTLLNISTPDQPTIISEGVYAIEVVVFNVDALTAGGSFYSEFYVDFAGDASGSKTNSPDAAANTFFYSTHTITRKLAAGAVVVVGVTNYDGSVAVNYQIDQATVQRIS